MRVFILCVTGGAIAAAPAFLDGTAVPVLAAVLVAGVVYAAWFVGHEQGWAARSELTDLQDVLDDGEEAA